MSDKLTPTLEPPPGPPAAAAKKKGFFSFDNRYLAPVLVTCILIGGHLSYGIIESYSSPILSRLSFGLITTYSPTFVAIISAIVMELIMGRFFTGRWPHLASAYISGISVGILIRSPLIWPYVLCSAISIVSKYVIRVRNRHLWNPSNLGVSSMLFLAPTAVASLSIQLGNEIWPMVIIWILGATILYRLGKLHITLTYVISFFLLGLLRSRLTGDPWKSEIALITGPMYQLYIFFMITDPKTTTHRMWTQCAVAVLIAVVEAIFRLNQIVHAPYYALFIVGPISNLIEIIYESYALRIKKAEAT